MRKAFSPLNDYAGHISLWGNECNTLRTYSFSLISRLISDKNPIPNSYLLKKVALQCRLWLFYVS